MSSGGVEETYLDNQEYSVGFKSRSVLIPKMAAYLETANVRGIPRAELLIRKAYERVVLST